MKVRRIAAMLASLLFTLAASASADDAGLPAFDAHALAAYLRPGSGVIEGRLVVQLPDGVLATRDRSSVLALPDTAYTSAWLRQSATAIAHPVKDESEIFEPPLPEVLDRYARGTHSDQSGYFHFRSLSAGRYIVRGRLTVAFPRSTHDDRAVYDYSFVWLQSDPINVGNSVAPDVVFHIVARRDKVARET